MSWNNPPPPPDHYVETSTWATPGPSVELPLGPVSSYLTASKQASIHDQRGLAAVYLVLERDEEVTLLQFLHSLELSGDLNLDRMLQRSSLQLGHLLGHGGRVEVSDSVPRHHLQDFVHLQQSVQLCGHYEQYCPR